MKIDAGINGTLGDRTYKLHSGITSEYGRYVKYPGVPVAGLPESDYVSGQLLEVNGGM